MSGKRICFVVVLLATISVTVILVKSLSNAKAESQASGPTLKSVILRRKDRVKQKPNAYEVALLRKRAMNQEERQLENKIPNHLPIRVKIRAEKEKNFKDLENSHWARDFELEVKNVGTKPIYHLVLLLLFPESEIGGGNTLMSLHYGPTRLSAFKENIEL